MRAVLLVAVLLVGLAVLLILRLVERAVVGPARPITAPIPRVVGRVALVILGLPVSRRGTPLKGRGAVVANHASWLDIFVLNGQQNIWFVAKAEVAAWPFIGWLARATGTLFIRRDRREATRQVALFQERLDMGHRLLFFPEGTSTDGMRVLPFKSTLFSAFLKPELASDLVIQPVSVAYIAPPGADTRFYGWWGEMSLGPHLFKVL
ncbi:MAG TPA: 1-acyl-sn-glycerol-3-phosphate acyltransferase, partial [Aliiroseovarius sp.]|nr:1-acyl-sn-glycerol-3-phosphate acyltransferase [Aliiroseovarius sp.]